MLKFYYNEDVNTIPKFKLIFGLGNPDLPADKYGKQYENTYHNAGYLFIDFLKKNRQCRAKIAKSGVYMNEAGQSLKKLINNTNIKPEEILIPQDDSDIALGKYKISFNRGSAGHKGIESVIQALGTKTFWRLRIGIRPLPIYGQKRLKAENLVLKKINLKNKEILEKVFREITEKLLL